MVNSISTSFIRGLLDELGLGTKIDSDGDIVIVFDADSDFKHDVLCFFSVNDNKWLRIYATTLIEISQSRVGETLIKLNEYNESNKLMKAYLAKNGRIWVERIELIDEDVSEEFIKENCIKLLLPLIWNFFKDNFAKY